MIVNAPGTVAPHDERATLPTYGEKCRANEIVRRARKRGQLTRPDVCQKCGLPEPTPSAVENSPYAAVQAHHEDYSRPLDVTWLCSPCHRVADCQRRVDSYRAAGYSRCWATNQSFDTVVTKALAVLSAHHPDRRKAWEPQFPHSDAERSLAAQILRSVELNRRG